MQSPFSIAEMFLSLFERKFHSIVGDGNCLFRCFSYILFGNEDKHDLFRSFLVEMIALNEATFTSYCSPTSVDQHVSHMRKPFV